MCNWVKSGGYVSEQTAVSVPQPFDVVFVLAFAEPQAPPPQFRSVEVIFSPPELSTTWQFSFRTALSPRAPAPVS